MTLQEWQELSDIQRDAQFRNLEMGTDHYLLISQLATEAAERLTKQLDDNQYILYVNPEMVSQYATRVIALFLYSDLPALETLEIIPREFCGFRVIRKPLAEIKRKYWNTWVTALEKLCGWDEFMVRRYLGYLLDELDQPQKSVVYYRGALYWVARALVDAFSPDPAVGGDRVLLERELKKALERQPPRLFLHPDQNADYDWIEAQERVREAFAAYGVDWSRDKPPVRDGPCLGN